MAVYQGLSRSNQGFTGRKISHEILATPHILFLSRLTSDQLTKFKFNPIFQSFPYMQITFQPPSNPLINNTYILYLEFK